MPESKKSATSAKGDESAAKSTKDPAAPAPTESIHADVCVMGFGVVGLINAIALAKRGLTVVCVDQPTEKQQQSYKVGESLLVYSNAFLRAIGELDDALEESFGKEGFWMAHGLEGRTSFDESVSEWGFESDLPPHWIEKIENPLFHRTMFKDSQIVRPEIEAVLREKAQRTEGLTFLDRGLVRDIDLGDEENDHVLRWSSRDKKDSGEISARWMVDCTGRSRVLARRYGHDIPLDDGFATTAAWAQFSHCSDELFDERWNFSFPDGDVAHRDRNTLHLWGDGYWIWLIRLNDDRISVGVTFSQNRPPEDGNARDVFWKILRRYPLLDWLHEDNVLEFSAYRDVQRMTNTFISPKRYAMVGDASSIIDAFYSQGISLSMSASWHIANIAQRDVRQGHLDLDYLDHVNRAATADWRIMRSMVRSKYGPAIADSRFFILDHLLDYMIFGAALLGRFRVSRWLTETGGRTDEETVELAKLRAGLERRLFLSQSAPWHHVDPHRFAGLVEKWHQSIESRAVWRLENGVKLPPTKAGLRAHAALPGVWRLPYVHKLAKADLTLPAIKEPEFMKVTGHEHRPVLMMGSGPMLVTLNALGTLLDVADTKVRKVRLALRRRRGASS
ncbi:FAD dependent oxidoreductase [Streptomyces albus]|uniref:FAD dependent oxidoreductase n=1 Tax=Streptomyces albus (strain ATCC 21838 / DSM 41398 / FERM P-419 / JCM 4703 / NBRC 107858) TaxID=1081613 RepID=A0A0B5EZX1_STRA4|nr:FAD dependent oxidoreductase [Streptomyces albus]AOU81667.1 FAD dependent oxidoreductase [Streptomyces albus]AYN37356.1 FAD dependent oxidoreductase [Streptomyces albus]